MQCTSRTRSNLHRNLFSLAFVQCCGCSEHPDILLHRTAVAGVNTHRRKMEFSLFSQEHHQNNLSRIKYVEQRKCVRQVSVGSLLRLLHLLKYLNPPCLRGVGPQGLVCPAPVRNVLSKNSSAFPLLREPAITFFTLRHFIFKHVSRITFLAQILKWILLKEM